MKTQEEIMNEVIGENQKSQENSEGKPDRLIVIKIEPGRIGVIQNDAASIFEFQGVLSTLIHNIEKGGR